MAKTITHYIDSLNAYSQILGPYGSFQWLSYRARRRFQAVPPQCLDIHPRSLLYPIHLRGGASSDVDVFEQVIMGAEYQPLADLHPTFILDLGANVGLSSAWFLSRFPQTTLLAVEPDPKNYDLCCRNLSHYGSRARVLLGAAWSRRTKLVLDRSLGDGREWGSSVHSASATQAASSMEVDGWDIGSLIKLSGTKSIDLLKIDIERAEVEVFGDGCHEWLRCIRNICIELHDKQCEAVFFSALRDFEYDVSNSGELTICRNLRLKNLP